MWQPLPSARAALRAAGRRARGGEGGPEILGN
jgi:hypothetical protein